MEPEVASNESRNDQQEKNDIISDDIASDDTAILTISAKVATETTVDEMNELVGLNDVLNPVDMDSEETEEQYFDATPVIASQLLTPISENISDESLIETLASQSTPLVIVDAHTPLVSSEVVAPIVVEKKANGFCIQSKDAASTILIDHRRR